MGASLDCRLLLAVEEIVVAAGDGCHLTAADRAEPAFRVRGHASCKSAEQCGCDVAARALPYDQEGLVSVMGLKRGCRALLADGEVIVAGGDDCEGGRPLRHASIPQQLDGELVHHALALILAHLLKQLGFRHDQEKQHLGRCRRNVLKGPAAWTCKSTAAPAVSSLTSLCSQHSQPTYQGEDIPLPVLRCLRGTLVCLVPWLKSA